MFLPVIDYDAHNLIDFPQVTGTPERRLLLAILERAILDYVGNEKEEIEAAEEWLFDWDAEQPPLSFSFPWICVQLDLEPGRILEIIRRMPRRGRHKVAPWYFAKGQFLEERCVQAAG